MTLDELTGTLIEESDFAFDANAEGLVDMLLNQFSDPFLSFRELVQNSLDENPSQIDIQAGYDKTNGLLSVSVEDDGNGMDYEKLQRYLKLFDSTKEDDLETIGEMGVGRIFVYTLKPKHIIVDTGDGSNGYKLVLNEDCSGQLKKGKPQKGTKVTLLLEKTEEEAQRFNEKLVETLSKHCKYVSIPLYLNGSKVNKPFRTKAKPNVHYDEFKVRGMISAGANPRYEFYKGGILLQSHCRLLIMEDEHAKYNWMRNSFSGTNVTLDSLHFSQPLSRNAVVKDRGYYLAVQQAFKKSLGLCEQVVQAYKKKVNPEKYPTGKTAKMRRYLLNFLHYLPIQNWPDLLHHAPLFKTVDRELVTFQQISDSFHRHDMIYFTDKYKTPGEVSHFKDRGIPLLIVGQDNELDMCKFIDEHFGAWENISMGYMYDNNPTNMPRSKIRALVELLKKIPEYFRQRNGNTPSIYNPLVASSETSGSFGEEPAIPREKKEFDLVDKIKRFDFEYFVDFNGKPKPEMVMDYEGEDKKVIFNLNNSYVQAMTNLASVNPPLSFFYTVTAILDSEIFQGSMRQREDYLISTANWMVRR